jgi:hypothetical protein
LLSFEGSSSYTALDETYEGDCNITGLDTDGKVPPDDLPDPPPPPRPVGCEQ